MTDETTGAPDPYHHPHLHDAHSVPDGDDYDNLDADLPHEAPEGASGNDLRWVWREVRKRVFIKLRTSLNYTYSRRSGWIQLSHRAS